MCGAALSQTIVLADNAASRDPYLVYFFLDLVNSIVIMPSSTQTINDHPLEDERSIQIHHIISYISYLISKRKNPRFEV